eukprot:6508645-Pyramimonas_sp.AAC.1
MTRSLCAAPRVPQASRPTLQPTLGSKSHRAKQELVFRREMAREKNRAACGELLSDLLQAEPARSAFGGGEVSLEASGGALE